MGDLKMSIFDSIKNLGGGNTLFYPGCLTKVAAKELENNYKKIFNKIGMDVIMLSDIEVCCGSPILNAGHKKEAKELMEKNLKIFKEHGVKKIVTACPACYHMFDKTYPEFLSEWDIKCEHASQTIARAIKEKKLSVKNLGIDVTFHDPCHLGRYAGVYDAPREVIGSFGNLKEMKLTKQYAFCCGGGSGVKSNYPEIANSVAKERIKMAEETKAKYLTTCCPMCYFNFKENSKGIKVKELSEFLVGEDNESK